MKHLFKVDIQEDGVLLSLGIKITPEEVIRISQNSTDPRCGYPGDLQEGYEEQGLEWLLHLLRIYISFGRFPSEFKPPEKKKKRSKKKRSKKKKISIDKMGINEGVSHYLMASYLYYILNSDTPLSDSQFDQLARKLLKEWKTIDHPHKKLLSKSSLRAGTLFDLSKKEYPQIVKNCALDWAKEYGITV